MPSDTHNNLQIHHRVFTIMNKLCLDRYPSNRYPALLLVGWLNFCLFTAGSHLCICMYCRWLCSFSNLCHFTYITTHSPTLLSLYMHHSSFSNPSIASPTSQFILQPFFCFSYVTSSSLNSPGKPPMADIETIECLNLKIQIEFLSLWAR